VVGDLAVSLFTELSDSKQIGPAFWGNGKNRSDFASANQDATTVKPGHFSEWLGYNSFKFGHVPILTHHLRETGPTIVVSALHFTPLSVGVCHADYN
jgi:hypothetical protein